MKSVEAEVNRIVAGLSCALLVGCAGNGELETTGPTAADAGLADTATGDVIADTGAPPDTAPTEDEGSEPEPIDLGPVVPNNPPVLVDDQATASVGGQAIPIKVLYNDADPEGHMLRVVEITQPEFGQAEIVYGGTQLRYTPPADGSFGTDTFQYTASDDHGGEATATVTVGLQGNPTLELTWPEPGATLDSNMVTVAFDVTGCQFTTPAKNSLGCHGHKFVDAQQWSDASGNGFGQYANSAFTIGPLAPGQHTFTLLLIKNDGSDQPWEPAVDASVTFVVP